MRRASARAKSSSVVSLMLPASPAKTDDLEPGPFGQRGVVGEIVAAGGSGLAVRVEQRGKGERLRRLHAAQLRAVERAGDQARGIDPLDRVGDFEPGDRRAGLRAGGDRARHQRGRAERPRRVVDQHDVRGARAQRLQAGPHRGLPGRAAEHRRQQFQALGGGLIRSHVVGMDDRLHGADLAMPGKQRKARPDHGLAGQGSVLLGQIAPGARPAPGCNDDGRDRGCHVRICSND